MSASEFQVVVKMLSEWNASNVYLLTVSDQSLHLMSIYAVDLMLNDKNELVLLNAFVRSCSVAFNEFKGLRPEKKIYTLLCEEDED